MVQRPLLRGWQAVAGVWFPHDWFDAPGRARRLLAAWRPGAAVLRFEQGDLLRYAGPLALRCEELPGWALCLQGRTLCSAAVSAAERAALPAADVWIVSGAAVLALDFRDGLAIDPAAWLDIRAVGLHDTYDCRASIPEPLLLTAMPPRDLREVLGPSVPPGSTARAEFLERMTRGGPALMGKGLGRRRSRPPSKLKLAGGLLLGLGALSLLGDSSGSASPMMLVLAGLAVLLAMLWRARPGAGVVGTPAGAARRPGGPGPAQALPARAPGRARPPAWRRWLDSLALTRQVGRLFGRQQAAYLRRMMEMFESGDLQQALRHAVPLGDDPSAASLGQALGVPRPREDLALDKPRGPSTHLDFGTGLQSHLRQLYRRSFERLDREGRIDEAVFVLAELLQSRQEALDYLERHERFRQAAELAMAWDRPADVIVRLQALAGDWRRAVAVARRDNAFATAVLQLESKWPEAARRLREAWAQALADKGDWLGAVDVIWPLADGRRQAVEWLLAAEAAGGQLGARALVQRAVLLPDTLDDCVASLVRLRDEPACHRERLDVARAVLALRERNPQVAALAAIVAGPLLADQQSGRCSLPKTELQRLLNIAGDPLLSADLPAGGLPAPKVQSLAAVAEPRRWPAPAPGRLPILDAVVLEDGRYLLALGEAGAVVVDSLARVLARFAVPVERIVISHSRQVALGLTRRDRVWRVSRLDLVRQRSTDLGVTQFDHAADSFDGIGWTVVQGRVLRVIDTGRSLHDVLWQVPDLPGQVLALSATPRSEQLLVAQGLPRTELWRYELPLRRLCGRDEQLSSPAEGDRQLLNPQGGVVSVSLIQPEPGRHQITTRYLGHIRSLSWPAGEAMAPDSLRCFADGPWLLWNCASAGAVWQLQQLSGGQVGGRMDWADDAVPDVRHEGPHWLLFDRAGRLLHVDTETGVGLGLSLG